ncbi:peptide-methionine (R)-S-oxide reductase MsrB [Candidatus Nanohalovita haloferacivicina]|uniref:peptide-methionine (R)-S-oxide reductase MsrB n=1 Tax=Candidatus Nanohalovita haloferacivicina TaxID=2978046 RepID=UPI00325FDDB0|nr:Peptide-methionine (R)-S-oxide reductase [Candidatus Nanohalobia archaeon BNXNv]
MDEEELKKRLSEEEYRILRESGTEAPGTGEFLNHSEAGVYRCKACGQKLFQSDDKFDSDRWPSFKDAIMDNIELKKDLSHGMNRVEVCCSGCGSHLGHVFDDGPEPTGKRYCINSKALDFEEEN